MMIDMSDAFTDNTIVQSESSAASSTPAKTRMKFNLICASKCKRFALDIARSNPSPTRSKMFSRVSEDFLIACEVALKNYIRSRVTSHPSKGKTLM